MPIEITMPRLSDTMEAGTVISWSVNEGDEVSSGDAVADIETDKATMEMQVFDDGTLASILVNEGDQVPVGTVIAVLAEEGEDVAEVKSRAKAGELKSVVGSASTERDATVPIAVADLEESGAEITGSVAISPDSASSDSGLPAATNGASRLIISPVARRLADEHEIDVKSLRGSGPSGRIIKRDVLSVLESESEEAQPSPDLGQPAAARQLATPDDGFTPGDRPLTTMRQTIAKRLVQSKTTIPHYQVTFVFNMDSMVALRKTLNEQLSSQGVKLSVNDFLVRACALSIRSHPEFNAEWGEDHITIKPNVNVGIAVALPREKGGGLVVATIRDADSKGLRQISEETKHLAEKARTRGLTVEEMSDSTFTISNLGMFGVEHFTAIINPPNAAILAVGGAQEKPVVRDGEIVIGHEMQATLSLDHRIIDGAMAAAYLKTLQQMIENPATLLV